MLTCGVGLLFFEPLRGAAPACLLWDTGFMTDEEIRGRFDATQGEMNRRFDATQEEMNRRFDATEDLIRQVAARLEARMDLGCAELKARFDRQDVRLERHEGYFNVATARLLDWSEKPIRGPEERT